MGAADELRLLATDLEKGLDQSKVRAVGRKGAMNIKQQLRQEASGSRWFKIAPHITFDESEYLFGPEWEIGPEKRGAGNLANIAYFGGAHGGGGTLPDPDGALQAEGPRFVQALADLAEEVL